MMPRSPSKSDRRRAELFGQRGEAAAALLLRAKGFRILAQRYKCPHGEVDLIARRGNMVVFVEVKARQSAADLAMALEAVNQRRLVDAANHFIMAHPELAEKTLRFDVIFVAPGRLPHHIRDAFRPL